MRLEFDWDQWNIQKNELKHGISKLEAESLFFDEHLVLFPDKVHSTGTEKRYIVYAASITNRVLMCAFTLRGKKIRIISVRQSSKKERDIYEEEKRK